MKPPFPLVVLTALILLSCGCTQYYSKTTFEYGNRGSAAADEAAIRALLPEDRSVSLNSIRGTGLYEIGVYDRDPERAAKRANALTVAVRSGLVHTPAGKQFRIWQQAEPPEKRKWPWERR